MDIFDKRGIKPFKMQLSAKKCYETIYRTYDLLLKFLEGNSLQMGEFAYDVYLLDEISNKNERDYITQITVKIEENKR
ncbi:hypothetical protein [Metaclostridioides mangenotii]|uniref:hypothetical protein n=1 Tax=Metaclostridioides mangenotii TaxID=1540 RepID=UPI000480AF62|nr:hypothetical protein [Clostridioides mangenotii]